MLLSVMRDVSSIVCRKCYRATFRRRAPKRKEGGGGHNSNNLPAVGRTVVALRKLQRQVPERLVRAGHALTVETAHAAVQAPLEHRVHDLPIAK